MFRLVQARRRRALPAQCQRRCLACHGSAYAGVHGGPLRLPGAPAPPSSGSGAQLSLAAPQLGAACSWAQPAVRPTSSPARPALPLQEAFAAEWANASSPAAGAMFWGATVGDHLDWDGWQVRLDGGHSGKGAALVAHPAGARLQCSAALLMHARCPPRPLGMQERLTMAVYHPGWPVPLPWDRSGGACAGSVRHSSRFLLPPLSSPQCRPPLTWQTCSSRTCPPSRRAGWLTWRPCSRPSGARGQEGRVLACCLEGG